MTSPLAILQKPFKQLVERISEGRSLVVPLGKIGVGESPPVTFERLRDYYLKDPSSKGAIDDFAAQVVGPGFYLTADDDRALNVMNEWNEQAAIDQWFHATVIELLYAGNSFTEYPEDLAEPPEFLSLMVELSSIVRIKRTETGEVQGIVQRVGGKERLLDSRTVMHFAWNRIDRSAFGTGLLYPLASNRSGPDNETIPPLLDIKAQMENDMRIAFHRYPPRYLIQFEAGDKVFEDKIKPALKDWKPGEDIAVNVKADVKDISTNPQTRFEGFLKEIYNQIYIGLESPMPRQFSERGFTEASARVNVEMVERHVRIMWRFLKRNYERQIVRPVLRAYGFDPLESRVRLNWGQRDAPRVSFQDMLVAYQNGAVTLEEIRRMLRKNGWELSGTTPEVRT